ncbi:MAG: FAD/NAD(P)-binding oxidoreductase [Ilumatobacter sp.]|uniref:NAD(P)/FAD-dependent oxidoreductase n=1 Tax=Ilumatobacter sp. TaxID=1967498 RepID=UPI0026385E1B|nr:FAD/NAD(P)-binding oxidoreductase [Ilumatobacter sp.]MDJ0770944.1 FAD/NAD(P)-binding oxidoreductase [Ilumatobacter sp.]
MPNTAHHRVVIVGGGAAGISVAARLRRKIDDIVIIEPSDKHWYHPLWTLVGAGHATIEQTERTEASVIPKGVHWVKEAATAFDPDNNTVETSGGQRIEYDVLIVCPGIQLDWDRIPGLTDTIGENGVSCNYEPHLAPKTWEFIQQTTSGTAVFTMPSDPIKCAGAPQKIAYLACDRWRQAGVLDKIDVHLVLPTPGMFGVPVFAKALEQVAAGYGINVHFQSELESIDADKKRAFFRSMNDEPGFELDYDMMHVVPHQSAPDWVKSSPLSTDLPTGYVDVDKHTMQHVRYPNVFALGDAGSTPNSKTGAAVRKQAPVVTANAMKQLEGGDPTERYGGYASCPLTTSGNRMLLAEFDYSMEPKPSFPLIDTTKPRRDMWYLKKYGLPFLYWNMMLKGRA